MKNILILGATGMLGSAVAKYFTSLPNDYNVTTTYRQESESFSFTKNNIIFDPLVNNQEKYDQLFIHNASYDYVINCIGIIKPFMAKDPIAARMINSIYPWELASWCGRNNIKLINITTDCVYSGKIGQYTESSLHDALDDYGKSKSLGEPVGSSMVIRTSIIGEEIHNNVSLIAWAKAQRGQIIKGYLNHFWNGITTNHYAKVCDKIIKNQLFSNGLYHVHARDDVSKFDMMNIFNKKYDLKLIIEPFTAADRVDRTMRSEKDLCGKLDIPTVEEMVNDI